MFQKLLFLLIVLLPRCASVAAQESKSAAPKPEPCSVSGKVVTLTGDAPLKGAIVTLSSVDDQARKPINLVSKSDGQFQFKGIAAGRYRLHVVRNGFVSQEYGQRTLNSPGAVLALSPRQDMKDLLFRMTPAAVIAGRIANEDGDALPWVHVSALREIYFQGKRTLFAEETVPTNDRGEYRLFGLRPGRYFLAAVYHPGAMRAGDTENDEFGSVAIGTESYVRTYYPGSFDPAKAETIAVKAGEELPSMDFSLRPATVHRITGRVFNLLVSGTKSSNSRFMVYLASKNDRLLTNHMSFGMDNVTNPDGTFELGGVLPGSYSVIAQWFDEGQNHVGKQIVEVSDADVEGIQVTIAKGVSIAGHVRWDGNPSLQSEDLLVTGSADDDTLYGSARGRVEPDGSFVWRDITGGPLHLNVFGLSSDAFVKAVSYGGVDSLEDGFNPRISSDATLEVTLSSRGARVNGAASDADGLPAVGVWVVLVPDGKRRRRNELYKKARTDQHGQFLLQGIAPGDYKLFSWDEVEEGAWEDPDFLKEFEAKAENVSMAEGETKTVNVVPIKNASSEQQTP